LSKLLPGTIFGRDFKIVQPLREGGMGAVYVAEQLSTGKQRALKVMAPELAMDAGTRERFVLEARAGSRIESDHVVEVVTAGVDEETGAPFLVMELLRGEELADASARLGPLPLGDVAEVLSQVGHALEQAHAQGIVHRDLKPENVFLAASRRRDVAFTAKILDFGIAKLVEDSRQKTGTQPLGTPLFMAPEQTDRKGRISPATDVWALGLIAFKLLTGRDFWRADGSLAMLLREICVDPIPFASVRAAELGARPLEPGEKPTPPLPPGFDAWFARCVAQSPEARFAEAGEAVRAFGELVTTDAPRGALIAAGTGSLVGSGAHGGGGATSGAGHDRTAGARAATGAPMTQPARATSSGSGARAGIAVGAVVLAAAAFFGYRFLSSGGAPPTAVPGAATPSTTPSSPASQAAAAPPACPSGMVSIAGGKMFMGARDLPEHAHAAPPHEVKVSAFCLDKTEVTTRAYLACVEKGECERPPDKVNWPGVSPADVKLYSGFCNASQKDRGDHPVNCVTWSMADGFCRKAGARLPTEAEWELAARGSSQRKYPWGDDPPGPRFLNACGKECASWFADHGDKKHRTMFDEDDGFAGTAPVGSFPAGAPPSGVVDLAGNVWEWTSDWFAPYAADPATDPHGPSSGTERVVRGGDFTGSEPEWASPAYRWKTAPETYRHAIGFRCAASPP
jgi:formylglycine-generating enzyme required for sulfatase activity/tRNA A-37 threonylcarbamoyl transferase component Bud32